MAELTFTFANLISGTDMSGPQASTFQLTWTGDTLGVGQTANLFTNGGVVPTPVIYDGLTEGGDPIFHSGGIGILFSNTGLPAGAAPPIVSTDPLTCFLAGTRIATPMGEVAVETLAVGDLVLTADGRCVPVKWIGRQTLSTRFGMSEGRRPVSIAAGALGNGWPVRDLRVTADHALLIDGVLVHAGALVNGTSIRRIEPAELGERFTVYHIETENHDVVLAEGAPAETFIDNVSRQRLDNYAEFEALYGAAPEPMEELPQPRAMSARQVPRAIRERIAAAAAVLVPALDEAA